MTGNLCLPYWIALRPSGQYSDAVLLDIFGLTGYRQSSSRPHLEPCVVLANCGEWALIADGLAYILSNRLSTRPAVEALGRQCEVFECYLADCIDEFEFAYYRDGRLIRRYSVTEGQDGPVLLADVGDVLPGEVDAATQPYRPETRLAVAAALGIKTTFTEQDVRCYVAGGD
jgi:hypothetical protein